MQLLQRNVVCYGKLLWQAIEWDMNQAHNVHMSSGLLLQRGYNLELVNIHIRRHYRDVLLGWAEFFFRENLCIMSHILLECVCFSRGQGDNTSDWSVQWFGVEYVINHYLNQCGPNSWTHIDGLMQIRQNSSALAIELRLSCTNPSICA